MGAQDSRNEKPNYESYSEAKARVARDAKKKEATGETEIK